MNKIIIGILVLAVSTILIGNNIRAAEAGTLSGTVKIDGVGANAAKVTAETVSTDPAVGYVVTTTGSSGTWSMTVSNSLTYGVDGMRSDATHGRVTGVNGNGQSNVNHNLNSRGLADVVFKISADEEFRTKHGTSWQSAAINKLNAVEPWFKTEHAIDFVIISSSLFYSWNSNNSPTGCGTIPPDPTNYLLDEVRAESGWNSGTYNGADILVAFTAQDIPGAQACAQVPTSGGSHPTMITEDHSGDLTRTIMHELTHNYGFNHDTSCNFEPSIMLTPSITCTNYIKNWRPAHDDTIESTRRGWY